MAKRTPILYGSVVSVYKALRAARWGAHYSADSEKRVSLVELSHFATAAYSEGPGTNCLASSTVSLDKRQQVSRMPRGCRLSELAPLELPPLLHNAFSRLSGILQHRRAATPDSRSVLNVAAEEQPRENQPSLVKLTDSGGVHLTWKTFPNTPWPQGRPEQSLVSLIPGGSPLHFLYGLSLFSK